MTDVQSEYTPDTVEVLLGSNSSKHTEQSYSI